MLVGHSASAGPAHRLIQQTGWELTCVHTMPPGFSARCMASKKGCMLAQLCQNGGDRPYLKHTFAKKQVRLVKPCIDKFLGCNWLTF